MNNNSKIKAVIFDLDGTLNDTIESLKYCGDMVMAKFGYGPFSEEQYKYFVGDGAANMIKRALIAGGDTELVHFERAYTDYLEVFNKYCMYEVKPYDGIRELLTELKSRGIYIAVLSNKQHPQTVDVIKALFGKDYFDIVLGQIDGTPIKPAPDGVYKIMEELGVKKTEVIYLGDTGTDMKTGKGAGLFTVGALWGFRDAKELNDNHADILISHPLELISLLEEVS